MIDPLPSATNFRSTTLRRRLVWVLILLLIGCGTLDWWYEQHKEHRFDGPILRCAQRYGVDPALVKAVVWRESKFNPRVRGKVGEIGLMQIRTLTAQEWAQLDAHQQNFDGNLMEPATNIQIGTWYLGKLINRYRGTDNPPAFALADYNAGRSNVLRWNKGPGSTNSNVFIQQITFPKTQEYIHSILNRVARYRGNFKTDNMPTK